MEPRTSESYKKEILEKYKKDKGGEANIYLTNPTRRQIREACLWLLDKRDSEFDRQILNRFFQFKNEENRFRVIQNFDEGKFRPVQNFLKEKVEKTDIKNLELVAWLIDFEPRPLAKYLRSDDNSTAFIKTGLDIATKETTEIAKPPQEIQQEQDIEKKKKSRRRLVITISIAIGAVLLASLALRDSLFNSSSLPTNTNLCMTWADSLYVKVSCSKKPYSEFGTPVEPLDEMKLKNFKKVEVSMATQFFTEDGKPLIWYYKNKDKEIEYYTAPGLHPISEKTLDEITEYIIQKYVPIHSNKEGSFIKED
ncbi:hypothetical protein [Flagellimonas oceanensis]|uniref:hypothetical protein n=1 Tax=Flagellimonas oceanensis TaxID=2499163 RepID=UPI003BAB9EE9